MTKKDNKYLSRNWRVESSKDQAMEPEDMKFSWFNRSDMGLVKGIRLHESLRLEYIFDFSNF